MEQDKKTTNKSGCTAVLAAAMIAAGGFSAYAGNQGTHGGEWKDTESLRWEWQNGEMSFYGNGSNGVQGVQTRLKRKDRFESK